MISIKFRQMAKHGLLAVFALGSPLSANEQNCSQIAFVNLVGSMVDFDQTIQPIFDRACVSCHSPGTETFAEVGLDLRPGHAHGALVGAPSRMTPGGRLVRPFFSVNESEDSILLNKVRCQQPLAGARMPPADPLDIHEQDLLYYWVFRGAPSGAEGSLRRQQIRRDLTGSWFNPRTNGQGVMLEIVETKPQQVVLYWMNYSGPSRWQLPLPFVFVADTQRWFVGVGTVAEDADHVDLLVMQPVGSVFEHADAPLIDTIGNARLLFHSCTEASLVYDLRLDNDPAQRQQFSTALRRLTPSPGCEDDTPAPD